MAVDLFEEKNLPLVYECILQLRKIHQRKQQNRRKRRTGVINEVDEENDLFRMEQAYYYLQHQLKQ